MPQPLPQTLRDRYPDLYTYNDSSGMSNLEELLRRLKTQQLDSNTYNSVLQNYFMGVRKNWQDNMNLDPEYTRGRLQQFLEPNLMNYYNMPPTMGTLM